MRSLDSSFWDRDDAALSAMLDERVDMLAGLRVPNFAAGANLKMSAPIDELSRWLKSRGRKLGMTASVASAARWALDIDPLFAALFDGRDVLVVPKNPSIGVGVDTGGMADVVVIRGSEYSGPVDLGEKMESSLDALTPSSRSSFSEGSGAVTSGFHKRKRWMKMVKQEIRERFDYLLPAFQKKRFDAWARKRGHMQVHNLGTHGVQEFKGFLRRPWVSMLWILEEDEIVRSTESGDFVSTPVLPLILVYAQELIAVDRACAFLNNVVTALSDPAKYLESGT